MKHIINLSEGEVRELSGLASVLISDYTSIDDEKFLSNFPVYAHEVPRRIRTFLQDFKMREPAPGYCVVSGFPVNDKKLGRTPSSWRQAQAPETFEMETIFVLLGSLLGDVFGWATQQSGRIVHDLFPIKEHETRQISSNSVAPVFFHTEDAFHPFPGDYLGLMCLRNHENVATTFASLENVVLSKNDIDLLFESSFPIRPDESHQNYNAIGGYETDSSLGLAYERIAKMNAEPQKIQVLFGDKSSPYLKMDPYFMDDKGVSKPSQEALNRLIQELTANVEEVVLQSGDICFLDNFKVVHGRNTFQAKYDGYDRWLKRVNITRDLRKSRVSRRGCLSRVIY